MSSVFLLLLEEDINENIESSLLLLTSCTGTSCDATGNASGSVGTAEAAGAAGAGSGSVGTAGTSGAGSCVKGSTGANADTDDTLRDAGMDSGASGSSPASGKSGDTEEYGEAAEAGEAE